MLPGPLCISLTPRTIDDVFASGVAGADCIEVRLDYLVDCRQSFDVRWDRLPLPVIATCRGRERGGQFDGSIEDEVHVLECAVRNGARFVDMDYRFARSIAGAQVIGSLHDFSKTPDHLDALLGAACGSRSDAAKIATRVRSWRDNRRLFDLMGRSWPKPVIVVGMGDMGQISRIIGPSRGSALTYACANEASAPGQIHVREMLDVYRFRKLTPATRLIGIIGKPVGHSYSPLVHNLAYDVLGLDFVYLKLPIDRVADLFENAGPIGIEGFSVTLPYKMTVARYLDEQTNAAKDAGAVNTVFRRGGLWIGDNTDVHGVREALKSVGFHPRGKRIVILGRGGAARAAIAALKEAGEIVLLSRSAREEAGYARDVVSDRIENHGRYPCDLLINATPVGMAPDVDRSPVRGPIVADVVLDMVYNPKFTRLLQAASEDGKTAVSGIRMFLAQAARQFEIWTGHPAPAEVFSRECL